MDLERFPAIRCPWTIRPPPLLSLSLEAPPYSPLTKMGSSSSLSSEGMELRPGANGRFTPESQQSGVSFVQWVMDVDLKEQTGVEDELPLPLIADFAKNPRAEQA